MGVMTIGDVARRLNTEVWKVRRVIQRGMVPEPGRVAHYRVFGREDLPAIEAALEAAGYRTTEPAA